jgi:ornithine cyclodeaminase/alanine dehydrogenase-like protein (mu-crystallin family)
MSVEFVFLSQPDVVSAGGTDMAAEIDVIEEAFTLKARGEVICPPKTMITWSDEPGTQEREGRIMAMPAWVGGRFDIAGVKWIPSVPANLRRGIPRANALIILSARDTGLPLAVMDGTIISAMRTGAVTGVCVRHLARTDATRAGLLGAGVLTRTQLMALAVAAPTLTTASVFDPDRDRAQRLVRDVAPTLPFALVTASSEEEACRDADIIIPSTLATEPVIEPTWVGEGCLVVLVSSLDAPVALHRITDLLVADDRDHEAGTPTRYIRRLRDAGVLASLEDVVQLEAITSGAHPGRTSDSQRIVCSPVGLGMDDVATAALVLEGARRQGLGTPLQLRDEPYWR